MRELHFDVAGQLLRRNKQCDFENIVRGSDNYLCLVFHFNQEWQGTKRVISFYDVDGKQTNEIIQDRVTVPVDVTHGSMFYFELTGKSNKTRIVTNRTYIEQI
jgi:hypothetical protein